MNTEIIVAAISGIVGVLGGVTAWVQAVRTARLKSEADSALEKMKTEAIITLEKMKAENERRRKAFELASQDSKPIEDAIADAWHDVQTIKEVISKILAPVRYDLDVAVKDFSPAASNLREGYGRWGANLPDLARDAWHKAKGSASALELALATLNSHANFEEPPEELIVRLQEMRLALTDCQMVLTASRQTIRDHATRQLFEVM